MSHLLLEKALERDLRPSTVRSYQTLLGRLGLLERDEAEVTREECLEKLWTLENVNTRRATTIAMRSVIPACAGMKIPRGVPRRYNLPDEDTLRLALMTSPHELRGLVMMYGGLRVGESCAVTHRDVHGDRLTVDKQVSEETRKLAPVKSSEATVVIPHWLAERLATVTDTAQPASVRESLRRAGKKVGIDLNPHLLRHWFATTMLERGVPLSLVSKQMRHSDVSVTLRAYSEHRETQIHEVFPS